MVSRKKKDSHLCGRCGREPSLKDMGIGRKCRIADLKKLSKEVEQGKRLIALTLSPEKYEVWKNLSSQRKKLAVFQCWENGWLYYRIGSDRPKQGGSSGFSLAPERGVKPS